MVVFAGWVLSLKATLLMDLDDLFNAPDKQIFLFRGSVQPGVIYYPV